MKRCFGLIVCLIIFILPVMVRGGDFTAQRREMVRTQIVGRGVTDPAVLAAMERVPRHLFVAASLQAEAYEDRPLPIGYGQTISQPYIVAFMTELIRPKRHHKVLEIGTGSGYQAAVLAEIVRRVLTMEIIPELGNQARERLKRLGYERVSVRVEDGYNGWREEAPFDAIIVTAAADHIPPHLLLQLKEAGKMVIPVGSPYLLQHLVLVEKNQGKITTQNVLPVRFVPLTRRR